MRGFVWFVISLITVLVVQTSVLAAEVTRKIDGHLLEIKKKPDGSEEVLTLDGKTLHANYLLFVDEVIQMQGRTVIVGTSAAGGNACDGAPFVVSFSKGSEPRLDGPLDSCRPVSFAKKAKSLMFSTEPVPGHAGESWTWTAGEGFSKSKATAFKPDGKKDWSGFLKKSAEHPSDAFSYKVIHDQIVNLTGSGYKDFRKQATGVGSGEFKGDVFVGSACVKETCDATGSLLIVDAKSKRVFLAYKAGKAAVVRPKKDTWPATIRSELENWSQQFGQ